MCSIGALDLMPYLIPVFAGSLLVGTSLMCFMRRSYESALVKVAGRITALEQSQAQQVPQLSYYPPLNFAVRPSAQTIV